MPQDELDSFLDDMAAEADRLNLSYSGNPNRHDQPVDAIDAMLEAMEIEIEPGASSRERRLREFPPAPPLAHEYTVLDDQPEDPEEWEQAQDTLNFFVHDLYNSPKDKNFESELRGFLSDEDYSYSAQTIVKMLETALKSHR